MKATADDGLVLHIQRVLPFPRTAVYTALTDPEQLRAWWGPRGFTSPHVDFEARVGGRYRIAMQPPEGDLFHLSGEFRAVEPPTRLAFTFRWDPPTPTIARHWQLSSSRTGAPKRRSVSPRGSSPRRNAWPSTKQDGRKAWNGWVR